MSIRETAERFIDACDSGKGWEACRQYCDADASFSAQAPALADVHTVEAYTEWAKGLLTPMPDANYELRSLAVDEDRNSVAAYAVFRGTHTGAGPLPPTGKRTDSDYVYVLEFNGDRIQKMTKIWNDAFALQQLGWA
jgi:predicted ester cyclase